MIESSPSKQVNPLALAVLHKCGETSLIELQYGEELNLLNVILAL